MWGSHRLRVPPVNVSRLWPEDPLKTLKIPQIAAHTMHPMNEPRLIIIGCGVSGIALACKLKAINYHNFVIYEREKDFGGTWYLNTYPGVGCDVESHYYSFSFNLNHNWSKRFAGQKEILQYVHDTADKFDVTPHIQISTEVVGAEWKGKFWKVTLRNANTGVEYTRDAEMVVSAVGVFNQPKDCSIPNMVKFKGDVIHTARWKDDYDITGKSVGVVGNGCSAAQLVPSIAGKVKEVVQFQRTPQWYFVRENRNFTTFEKFLFNYIPLYDRLYRMWLFYETDSLHTLYLSDTASQRNARAKVQKQAKDYMLRTAPKKYHDILIPNFQLGCKRRIFDPGYLESLHRPNVLLTTDSIVEFTEHGLRTDTKEYTFDTVVLATGYKIQEFLQPLQIVGEGGVTLDCHWKETNGAQAYKGAFNSGFPNFGIIFGPNSFPAHNSAIFTNEVSCEYLIKAMISPIVRGDFDVIDVKEASEMYDATYVQRKLKNMVWSSDCASWNVNENGRNTTSYYDYAYMFWIRLLWPKWTDFNIRGGRNRVPTSPAFKAFAYLGGGTISLTLAYFVAKALVPVYLTRL
jgi:cation diffusion facilitator CzcD-associated flavoprotein CzcO